MDHWSYAYEILCDDTVLQVMYEMNLTLNRISMKVISFAKK
jgi:hypothetical protein